MVKEHRRLEERGLIAGPLRLTWTNSAGTAFHVLGKCVDASRQGMKIEVSDPIPLLTSVGISVERIGFAGSASVRHIVRTGRKYTVGLYLTQPLPQSLLTRHVTPKPMEPNPDATA